MTIRIEGFRQDVDLDWLTDEDHVSRQLHRYFVPLERYRDQGSEHFTGRFFEWHVERSDPSCFTESDLLAVQRLSITVPTQAAYELLDDRGLRFSRQIERCWEQIGDAEDLRSLDETALEKGPLVDLYRSLVGFHDIGQTTASKLMATKFSAHVPIQDSRVTGYLGATGTWWKPIRELLSTPRVAETLAVPNLPGPRVELLRRLDALLWMQS